VGIPGKNHPKSKKSIRNKFCNPSAKVQIPLTPSFQLLVKTPGPNKDFFLSKVLPPILRKKTQGPPPGLTNNLSNKFSSFPIILKNKGN